MWVRRAEVDRGPAAGRHARRARADPGAGAGEPRAAAGQRDPEGGLGFLRAGARPATAEAVRFIDEHRERVRGRADLPGAAGRPVHLLRREQPAAVGPRACGTRELKVADRARLGRAPSASTAPTRSGRSCSREGIPVARCTVERLMRELGLARRGAGQDRVRTTFARRAQRPAGRPGRRGSSAPRRPNRLWVADLTYVKTHTRLGLRRLRRRRLLAAASSAGRRRGRCAPTWRSTRWRWRSGRAAAERPRRADPPLRPRRAVPRHPLHRAPGRGRRRCLGRLARRQLRQRPGRVLQRALQDRADPPPGPWRGRRRRVRHPGVRRLVQPPPPPRRAGHGPTRRARPSSLHSATQPESPQTGAVQATKERSACPPGAKRLLPASESRSSRAVRGCRSGHRPEAGTAVERARQRAPCRPSRRAADLHPDRYGAAAE